MGKKRKVFGLLLLFVCVSLLAVLPVSAERSKRKYNITVSDVRVSKKNLKPGDRCKVSMKIRNKGYQKLDRVGVTYTSPSTQYYYLPLKYKKSSGRWVGTFKVEKGMQKGRWQIQAVEFDMYEGDEGGWYSYYNRYFVGRPYPGGDLTKGDIRIRGTKADYSKPEIDWDSLSVSKSEVTQKGGKITYRLKVTDESPIDRVVLNVAGPKEDGIPALDTRLPMEYNKKTGYYEGTIWQPKGTYYLNDIYVEDVLNNSGIYVGDEEADFHTHIKKYHGLMDFSKYDVKL